jgi:TRAP-type C4-dicarboxylate transport system substrate-binding protein
MAVFLAGAWSSPSEAKAEITLRMAGQSPADHQSTLGMQKVSKWVAEATNGRIDIKTYPSSQLGDYTLVYEELIRGTIDMALISIPSQFDSRLELIYVPYLMRDYGEAAEVFKQGGWLFNKMAELHGELGVLFLGFNVEGFGGLGLTKEPKEVLNPLVKKDLLLRVPPMDTFKIGAEDMG